MDKKFIEVSQIKLRGTKDISGMKFHEIEGGFGESKKSMLAKEIANIHGRELKKVNELINNNKIRFKENVDIVDLKGTEFEVVLKDHGIYSQNSINRSENIYLLSERGYSKLLKIMDDDIAWDKYDKLVDGYFDMREKIKEKKQLSPMEQLRLQYEVLEEHDEEIKNIRGEVKKLKNDMPLFNIECDELQKEVKKIGVKALGGKDSLAYKDKSTRTKVYTDIQHQVKRQFGVNSYKAIKRSQLDIAKEIINKYELPYTLKNEIEAINNQISFK